MTNVPSPKKIYHLEERTAKFGEEIIRFTQKIPKNSITNTKSVSARKKPEKQSIG